MPELPEVETIKNDLTPRIVGRRFTGVSLLAPRLVRRPGPESLGPCLVGRSIAEVARRGKYLIFRLAGKGALVLHLRMSGSLLLKPGPDQGVPHTRALFHLDDGLAIYFCDRRKLGTIELVGDESEVTAKLGPEPLEPSFTSALLGQRLSGRKAPIKAVLCDQRAVAGIGNMYADEALFSAGIHPLKPAGALSPEEIERLRQAIVEVLQAAIGNRGATIADYSDASGQPGSHQYYFRVAHRRGQTCLVCGTAIQRITVRNRGTYFCPHCQGALQERGHVL